MYKKRISEVRQLIAKAKQQESAHKHLSAALGLAAPGLHAAIILPPEKPEQTLANFVIHYLDHVPDFIEALVDISMKAKIEAYTGFLLNMCLDFFLSPPEVVQEHSGLLALLDEAYLAHRLMEEVNDQMLMVTGIPLIPMDMTNANLIVHGLIGEEFANQLDTAVYFSLTTLTSQRQNLDQTDLKKYVEEHQLNGWENDLKTWPCLAGKLDIELSFTN